MKVKLAIYKSINNGGCLSFCNADIFDRFDDYIKLSETVEVDFPDLPKEEVNSKEIAIIDKAIQNEMAKSESRLNQLKQRKQELLALPEQVAE